MFPFTLRQLEVFQEILRAGSFRQAAANLKISQPGISRQIAALEYQLGTRLFNRTGGVAAGLTVQGELFAEDLARFMEAGHVLAARHKRRFQKDMPVLRLFIDPYLRNRHVNARMARFEPLTRLVNLIINEGGYRLHSLAELQAARIDLGVYATTNASEQVRPGVSLLNEVASGIYGHRKFLEVPMRDWPFLVPPRGSAYEERMVSELVQSVGFYPQNLVPAFGYGDIEDSYVENGSAVIYRIDSNARDFSPDIVKLHSCKDWFWLLYKPGVFDDAIEHELAGAIELFREVCE